MGNFAKTRIQIFNLRQKRQELYLELYIIRFFFAEYFGSRHLHPSVINNNNSERYLFSELQWDAGTF